MAGMNIEEKQDMCRFILDVNDHYGTTIVLIEHDMGVVMDISDRVVVLDYGRKIGDGTPDEVRANQEVIDAYLGVAALRTRNARLSGFFIEVLVGGLLVGDHVFAGRARLRADLQGLGRLQLRAGRDGVLRGADLRRLSWSSGCRSGPRSPVAAGGDGARRLATERFVLRPLVNQPRGSPCSWPRSASPSSSRASAQLRVGRRRATRSTSASRTSRSTGSMDTTGMLISQLDLVAGVRRRASWWRSLALCSSAAPASAARLRAVADDHQAALSIGIPLQHIWMLVWATAGVVALVAGMLWGARSGVQFALIVGRAEGAAGADPRRLHLDPRRDRRRPHHRRVEKLAEVYLGPMVGGGIEGWFPTCWRSLFLLVRPEGLFGEKIIRRV